MTMVHIIFGVFVFLVVMLFCTDVLRDEIRNARHEIVQALKELKK